jgi:dimethylhistidine N-methyltransferase
LSTKGRVRVTPVPRERRSLRSEALAAFPVEAIFREVTEGFHASPKRLPEKLLYDSHGARLFDRISGLDAYYPTRTEVEILRTRASEIRALVGPRARVVELGTGSGAKTDLLLESLDSPSSCVLVDIAEPALLEAADRLRLAHPGTEVVPLVADYTKPFALHPVGSRPADGPLLFFFPGSTIGNFEPADAESFLRAIGSVGGPRARLLIGADLVKSREVLELAYNDPEGVTAEFNLNVLRHLNRTLRADFRIDRFHHRALWNEEASRIEMRLVSAAHQRVTLRPPPDVADPLEVEIARGEEIVTEHSYKYRPSDLVAMWERGGWDLLRTWSDPRRWFAVSLLEWKRPD